jgi:hypothetical protein
MGPWAILPGAVTIPLLLVTPRAPAEESPEPATDPADTEHPPEPCPTPGPSCGEVVPLFPGRPEERTIEFDLPVLVGVRHVRSLRGFDDALRASGYGGFPQSLPSLGGHMGVTLGRWRLRFAADDAWMSAASSTGSHGTVSADLVEVRVDGGYDFLRWRTLTGFALLGIGGSTFTMDAVAPNWNYLGAQGAVLGNPTRIRRDAGLLTLQAGFSNLFVLGRGGGGTVALLASIQAGYTQQLGLGPWFAEVPHANVPGTPDVDFSGTWVALGAGVVWYTNHSSGLSAPE